MNAVTVTVEGVRAPLLYVGPGQINFLLPFGLPAGSARIVVTNAGSASQELAVPIDTAAPGIFTLDGSGQGQGAVLVAGMIARAPVDAASRPARPGEIIEIYGASLGPVDAAPPAGAAAPAAPLARTRETPAVFIDGEPADVLFSGLAPGWAGLYQVNARVPPRARTGTAIPVTMRIAERSSNTVTIAVAD
jgi:uncharacterized protein (TIGR03437 family)